MKSWVVPYINELIPDPLMREAFWVTFRLMFIAPFYCDEVFIFEDKPNDYAKDRVYVHIGKITRLFLPMFIDPATIPKGTSIWKCINYDFNNPQNIEEALNSYNYTSDFLLWTIDIMLREKYIEGVVLVEKKLAEMGALDEGGRFEL